MKKAVVFIGCIFFMMSALADHKEKSGEQASKPFVLVLGIAQDGGYPHPGCIKDCCEPAWSDKELKKMVASIGIVDSENGKNYIIDATPDFGQQQHYLNMFTQKPGKKQTDGIFLTHAHIGHYTGLMYLGREAMNTKDVPVYALPRMEKFIKKNQPWKQLIQLNNIKLERMKAGQAVVLSEQIRITPIIVPHRDELSETCGFIIQGPEKKLLYIPDIDKWSTWDRDIISLIKEVDYALLDGTFYENGEIGGRDMSLIPHPFIEESMKLFKDLPAKEKKKISFIHLNHTNPAISKHSKAYQDIKNAGYNVASELEFFGL